MKIFACQCPLSKCSNEWCIQSFQRQADNGRAPVLKLIFIHWVVESFFQDSKLSTDRDEALILTTTSEIAYFAQHLHGPSMFGYLCRLRRYQFPTSNQGLYGRINVIGDSSPSTMASQISQNQGRRSAKPWKQLSVFIVHIASSIVFCLQQLLSINRGQISLVGHKNAVIMTLVGSYPFCHNPVFLHDGSSQWTLPGDVSASILMCDPFIEWILVAPTAGNSFLPLWPMGWASWVNPLKIWSQWHRQPGRALCTVPRSGPVFACSTPHHTTSALYSKLSPTSSASSRAFFFLSCHGYIQPLVLLSRILTCVDITHCLEQSIDTLSLSSRCSLAQVLDPAPTVCSLLLSTSMYKRST